jgi:uncharacterized integral membrane protein
MPAIFLSVIFGLGIGYFATQNTSPVTIHMGELILENVPLYLVVLGSLLLGLFLAWTFYFARTLSTTLAIYGRDSAIKKAKQVVTDLEQRVRDLEAVNARLNVDGSSAARLPLGAETFSH